MPPSVPDQIRSSIINHTVDLHRYEAGLQRKIRAMIDQLGKDLVAQIAGAGLDTPRTDWQRSRLQALLNDAGATIGKAYEGITSTAADEIRGLVQVTAKAVTTACNDAFGAKLMVPVKWTPELLAKIADGTLIHGAPSAEWWSRQSDGLTQAFEDQMRQGMLRGENLAQLRDRILGQNLPGIGAAGKVDLRKVQPGLRAPIWTARRNAEALVRTSVISTANAAHMAAYEANADIMEGVQWCSTLDGRTTMICRGLDGLRWDLQGNPIGHDHAYPGDSAHWGCRSARLPCTKSWETLAREAGGDTRLARELDKMPEGNRASMGGPVSGSLRYEDWFNAQSEKRQLQILGPGKLDLYQKGKLGFTDMLNQSGNPMTLRELTAKMGGIPTSSAVDATDLARWMARPSGNLPAAPLSSELQKALGTDAKSILFSPETLAKQLNNHPEIKPEDYARLFGKIDDAEIYRDGVFKVALVIQDDRAYRMALKVVQDRTEVFMTSFHSLRERTLEQVRKLTRIY